MKHVIFRALVFVLLCGITVLTQAQPAGYEIKISSTNIDDNYLYLQAYRGQDAFVFDSAKVKGHKSVVFKNSSKQMPSGIYTIIDRFGNEYLDLIIDKNRQFSISGDNFDPMFCHTATVTGSDENTQFFSFQKQLQTSDNPQEVAKLFCESMPESLLAHFLKAKFNLNPALSNENDTTPEAQYETLVNHFFDNITFEDDRLFHTPFYIALQNYFLEILPKDPLILENKSSEFLSKTRNTEIYEYYLAVLLNLFDRNINSMAYDQTFVWLYDKYCAGKTLQTLPEDMMNYYKRSADRKRKLLPGEKVPELICSDINNVKHSSKEIDNEYIILWFWDADCDDCVEMTPKLHDFYREFAKYYDVEVFSVMVTDDLERWDRFSKNNDLSWINLSYAIDDPNYDFIDYFDIITTPVIYLIDKNHTIINRNFPLEELFGIFDNLKNKEE